MAAALPRLRGRSDPASRALRRALWTTALGTIPSEERAWIARIEARRAEMASGDGAVFSKWMSIAPVWGRFLMRIVRELSPSSCLELGTAFGISAAYQAAALELSGAGRLITLERADPLATFAEDGFTRLELDRRVELRRGEIDDSLAELLPGSDPFDYAFLDADHVEDATLAHFTMLLPHLREGAVVVLDDVNWSDGMRRAWDAISHDRRVSAAVAIRRMGIVVLDAPDPG
jgi:predicted O-methyltransferase YrrM